MLKIYYHYAGLSKPTAKPDVGVTSYFRYGGASASLFIRDCPDCCGAFMKKTHQCYSQDVFFEADAEVNHDAEAKLPRMVKPVRADFTFSLRAIIGSSTRLTRSAAVLRSRCGTLQHVLPKVQGWTGMVSRPSAANAGKLPRFRNRPIFLPSTYAAACLTCHGVGTLKEPAAEKLIIHPEKPLCCGGVKKNASKTWKWNHHK